MALGLGDAAIAAIGQEIGGDRLLVAHQLDTTDEHRAPDLRHPHLVGLALNGTDDEARRPLAAVIDGAGWDRGVGGTQGIARIGCRCGLGHHGEAPKAEERTEPRPAQRHLGAAR